MPIFSLDRCKTIVHSLSSGRPCATDAIVERKIVELIEEDRSRPAAEIVTLLKQMFPDLEISARTVRKRLVEAGYHGRVAIGTRSLEQLASNHYGETRSKNSQTHESCD